VVESERVTVVGNGVITPRVRSSPEPLPSESSATTMPVRPYSTGGWKLIVAAPGPWSGEIYHTRPGQLRQRFSTIETFCSAFLAITGWSLPPNASGPADPGPTGREEAGARSASRRRSARHSRSGLFHEPDSVIRKFVVAAEKPWQGEIYRTRPGLKHFRFTTFEQFLRAVQQITGWPLE